MSSQTVVSPFSTSNLSLSESSSLPVGQSSFFWAQTLSASLSSSPTASTTSAGSVSTLASSRAISSSIEALASSTASLDSSSTVADENKSNMSASPASSSEAANVTSPRAGLPEDGSSSTSTSTSVQRNTQTSVESSSSPTSESTSAMTSGTASETDDGSTPKPPSAPTDTTSSTNPTTGSAASTQTAQPGQTSEATNEGTVTTTPVNVKATTSAETGLPAGASVAVVVTDVNGTTITRTSTSLPPTLASPIGVTVVDSSGHTSLTYPAIVTVLSTGTNSDGSLTTETKVVVNPTGETSHRITDPDSFFSNTGAVAGTFVAVGIVITSIAAFLYLCYRRKRRARHQLRWLEGMHSPRPQSADDLDFDDDPFEDRNAAPEMLQRPRTPPALPEPSRNAYASVPQTATAQDFRGLVAAAPSSGGAFGSVAFKGEPEDPFHDVYSPSRPIGLAVTTASLASGQETPSLYSKQEEEGSIYEEVDIHSDEGHSSAVAAPLALPARPPRSLLRASNSVEYKTSEYKPSEYRPISPPTTVESSTPPSTPVNPTPPSSSHGSTAKQVSPYSVLTRKTLLDIRPRPSQDNVRVARI
ncbi:hypothetical protein BDZ89DRAFT_192110 [Hymenopellis radicata]|nr:hypothetical protein BDZ89DRAFT_192110 [Hymenopellis radicata]